MASSESEILSILGQPLAHRGTNKMPSTLTSNNYSSPKILEYVYVQYSLIQC